MYKKLSSYFKKGKNFAKPSAFGRGNRAFRVKKSNSTKYANYKKGENKIFSMRSKLVASPLQDGSGEFTTTVKKPMLIGAILTVNMVSNAAEVLSDLQKGITTYYNYTVAKMRVKAVEKDGGRYLLLLGAN